MAKSGKPRPKRKYAAPPSPVRKETPAPVSAEPHDRQPPAWTRHTRWLWIALPLFCLYRIAHFQLQPLDAPGTLRAILYPMYLSLVHSFRSTDAAAHRFVTICAVVLAIPIALVLLQSLAGAGRAARAPGLRILLSRPLFVGSMAVALLVCRFPQLLREAANPDENEWLVAAQKFLVDPLAFRSVDQHTSGPLVAFPLDLAALFGFSPDYAAARVIAVILITASLYILLRTVRLMSGEEVARAAVLPAFMFFAIVTNPDFIHYSSETFPLLLISLAIFACASVINHPESYSLPLCGLGALAVAAFFAKMQCLPIVLSAGALAILAAYRDGFRSFDGLRKIGFWRPPALFLAGMAPVGLIAAAAILIAGAGHDWWFAYLVANYKYTRSGGHLLDVLKDLAVFLSNLAETQLLLLALLVLLACSLYLLLRGRPARTWQAVLELLAVGGVAAALAIHFAPAPAPHMDWHFPVLALLVCGAGMAALTLRDFFRSRPAAWLGLLAFASLSAGVFSIFASHNMFPHYLLLLLFPLTLAVGWLLSRDSSRSVRLGLVMVVVLTAAGAAWYRAPLLFDVFLSPPPVTAVPEGPLIRRLTPHREPIEVWGWDGAIYLSAARTMATRDTHLYPLFCCDAGLESRFRDRFLRDIQRYPAGLIVDALDVSCCYMNDRNAYGFETVPAIQHFIDAHYIRVAEQFRERFYLRRELASLGAIQPCDNGVLRCYQAGSLSDPHLAPFQMPEHVRLEAEFTPIDAAGPAVIFGTQSGVGPGFEFMHVGGGKYLLLAGDAGRRIASAKIPLPDRRHVSLAIEFSATDVSISCGDGCGARLRLDHSLAGTEQSIVLAQWKDRDYAAALDRFEVRDLAAH